MSNARTGSVAAGDTITGKVGHNTIFHTDAYQIAVKNGFEGTIEEWLESLNGVSATHEWEGTVLTITSASGTSSADLKGEKGETGETGPQGPKGEKGDTPTLEEIGAAPSGYGLGGTSPSTADLNTAIKNGFARISSATLNYPFTHGAGIITNYSDSEIVQYINSATVGCEMIRRSQDGGKTWIEEWVNPPMELGVEYRTTERYLGSPIYRKLVNFGTLPASTVKKIVHGISGMQYCLDAFIRNATGSSSLTDYKSVDAIYGDATNMTIQTNADMSTTNVYVEMAYTKYE